jgi:hypothetical protein
VRTAAQRISSLFVGSRVLTLAAMTVALTLLVFSGSALASSSPGEVQIISLEPNHGPTSGGTRVVIHGEPLENARSVHFGAVEGKIVEEECGGHCEIMPYRTLVVESPPHSAGTVDVTVETAQGVSVASPGDKFTYGPSGGPSIESVSVSHVTPTDATLEAQIDTEGQSALYEFQLWTSCELQGLACQWIKAFPLPDGLLLPAYQGQSVSLDLNSVGVTLRLGTVYGYSVKVVGSTGDVIEAPSREFEPPGEPVVEPLSTTTSTPSITGQSADSNSGEQPAEWEGSSSSSVAGVGVSGTQTQNTSAPKPLTRAQKLANALKACEKRDVPRRGERAACEARAHKLYGPSDKRVR